MPQSARRGQPWLEEEELQLLQEIHRKESHAVIAKKHKRTEGAIRSHLEKLACEYHFNENRSIEEIMKFTGLSKETIEESIKKRDEICERKKSPRIKPIVSIAPRVDSQVELLKEIRDLMKEMVTLLRTP